MLDTSAKSLAKARKIAKVREFESKVVLRSVMQHKAGRAWMFDVLSWCGITQTPFAPGDPHATAFNCGQQNIGLRLVAALVETCPDEYTTMTKEHQDDRHEPADADASDDVDSDSDDPTC